MDTVKHLMNLGLIHKIGTGKSVYESGPNAILLSDESVQAGRFWNLAEFPFLHMLYRQGMIIPGHPGNTGTKPILMGSTNRCKGVLSYIYRGTYGLVSRDEMSDNGVPDADLDELWNLKVKFAGGEVRKPNELVNLVPIDGEDVSELPGGVTVRRTAANCFVFRLGKKEVSVDLNLKDGEDWKPSYTLPRTTIPDAKFSVTHIGEGNGWDPARPCMGSIVSWRGRHYLIDAGPGIDYSLAAVGLKLNDISGLIFTHAHDDHFAGLTTLMDGKRRLTVYGTRPVMATVKKKAAALLEVDTDALEDLLDIHYLEEDKWNRLRGMEVRPTTSPHPLETTIVFFRGKVGSEKRTYAHLADIISMSVLDRFVGDDGISRKFYKRVRREYSRVADIKKIDAGRGLIHGSAEDFTDDESAVVILSHTVGGPSPEEKAFGIGVDFGHTDILIP